MADEAAPPTPETEAAAEVSDTPAEVADTPAVEPAAEPVADAMEGPSPEDYAAVVAEKDAALSRVQDLTTELAALREMAEEVPGLREAMEAARAEADDMRAQRDAMAAEKDQMSRAHAMERAGVADGYGDFLCYEYDRMEGDDKPDFADFLDSMKATHSAMFKGDDKPDDKPDAMAEDAAVDVPAPAVPVPVAEPVAVGNPANTAPKTATPPGTGDHRFTREDVRAMSNAEFTKHREAGALDHIYGPLPLRR